MADQRRQLELFGQLGEVPVHGARDDAVLGFAGEFEILRIDTDEAATEGPLRRLESDCLVTNQREIDLALLDRQAKQRTGDSV